MNYPPETPNQNQEKILTPAKEPSFSVRNNSTDERLFFGPALKPTPDAETLMRAVTALSDMLLRDNAPVREGHPGDAFLVYDFALRVHGEKPLHLKGVAQLHGLLSEEGISTAPGEVESALYRIWTPIRNRIMQLVNAHAVASRPTGTPAVRYPQLR